MKSSTNESTQSSDAVIFALESRRFVIVRPDETERFSPADPECPGIHELKPGDEVIYDGERDAIRSLSTF